MPGARVCITIQLATQLRFAADDGSGRACLRFFLPTCIVPRYGLAATAGAAAAGAAALANPGGDSGGAVAAYTLGVSFEIRMLSAIEAVTCAGADVSVDIHHDPKEASVSLESRVGLWVAASALRGRPRWHAPARVRFDAAVRPGLARPAGLSAQRCCDSAVRCCPRWGSAVTWSSASRSRTCTRRACSASTTPRSAPTRCCCRSCPACEHRASMPRSWCWWTAPAPWAASRSSRRATPSRPSWTRCPAACSSISVASARVSRCCSLRRSRARSVNRPPGRSPGVVPGPRVHVESLALALGMSLHRSAIADTAEARADLGAMRENRIDLEEIGGERVRNSTLATRIPTGSQPAGGEAAHRSHGGGPRRHGAARAAAVHLRRRAARELRAPDHGPCSPNMATWSVCSAQS